MSNVTLIITKAFNGEMVRGKVTINNVQQNVVQKPYAEYSSVAWSAESSSSVVTNQTVNIDTSQLVSKDGKHINIIINVYGPPGFSVNGVASGSSSSSVRITGITLLAWKSTMVMCSPHRPIMERYNKATIITN